MGEAQETHEHISFKRNRFSSINNCPFRFTILRFIEIERREVSKERVVERAFKHLLMDCLAPSQFPILWDG